MQKIRLLIVIVILCGGLAVDAWRGPILAASGRTAVAQSWTAAAGGLLTPAARRSGGRSSEGQGSVAPRQCATSYHGRLADIRTRLGEELAAAEAAARVAHKSWPGRWFNWDPRKAVLRNKLSRAGFASGVIVSEDQVCEQVVLGGGGRSRCLKWKPKPENYVPPKPKPVPAEPPPPSADELKLLRGVMRFVQLKGLVPTLTRNATYYHLIRRMSDELLGFLSQPLNENLCSGTPAMLSFYRQQFLPFSSASDRAVTAALDARARMRALLKGRPDRETAQAAPPTGRLGNPEEVTRVLRTALEDVGRAHLMREHRLALERAATPVDMLAILHEALKADGYGQEVPLPARHRRAQLLRTVELSFYTDRLARKYMRLSTAFEAIMDEIAGAYRDTCVCH